MYTIASVQYDFQIPCRYSFDSLHSGITGVSPLADFDRTPLIASGGVDGGARSPLLTLPLRGRHEGKPMHSAAATIVRAYQRIAYKRGLPVTAILELLCLRAM